MAVGDAYVFPGFLTPVLTQLFLPKPPTTFLTCFCRGERRKYAGKKSRLDWGSNSQPQGHESDTLTTEPPRRGQILDSSKFKEIADNNIKLDKNGGKFSERVENAVGKGESACYEQFLHFPQCFKKDLYFKHVKSRDCLGKG